MTADDDLAPAERAELAVLDMALEEALHERAPHDVWPALAAHPPRAPRRSWLVAALMLLGLTVVGGVLVLREFGEGFAGRPLRDPNGPASVAALVDRLQRAAAAMLVVRGAWSEDDRLWVEFHRHPLDGLLVGGLSSQLRRGELATIAASLATARELPVDDGIVWTHMIASTTAENRCSVVLQWREGATVRVGYVGPRGAVPLDVTAFPLDELPSLAELTQQNFERLGFVVGASGFAKMRAEAESLQLQNVPASRRGDLARFTKLSALQLHTSPEWHRDEVLEAITAYPLRSLWLRGDLVASHSYRWLARLTTLQDLSLLGDPMRAFREHFRGLPLPALDDAALAHLGTLPALQELALADGTFGDDGVRSLASAPLRELMLLACDDVRGDTLPELRTVRRLMLVGCRGLRPDVLATLGAMPRLEQLGVLAVENELRVAALPASTTVQGLALTGRFDRRQLPALARCERLTKLELKAVPPLVDEDLDLLRGLRQLRHLSLVGGELSPAAVQALRASLPGCRVEIDDR